MRDDGGGGGGGPYAAQTAANTHPAWLEGGPKVDVDLDGMGEFAQHMGAANRDLMGRMSNVGLLMSMPQSAWEGVVLGEADYTRHAVTDNASELTQYLGHLAQALLNIGMAAQTIADLYASTDGTSAASLDAVRFAYGEPGAPRPANLPPGVDGRTYWDMVNEAREQGTTPIAADAGGWRHESTIHPTSYVTVETATGPDGQRREITTMSTGYGTEVTTAVYAANGALLSRQVMTRRQEGATTVTSTAAYGANGRPTGRTEERTRYDGDGDVVSRTSTDYDGSGDRAGSTTMTTADDDGVQTTTTTNAQGKVTQEVTVGPQTEGSVVAPDSPAQKAYEDLPGLYLR